MAVNGFGAFCTAVVMLVFGITKFADGAWIVIVLVPAMVTVFFGIHHHYRGLARQLSLENFGTPPRIVRHRVILPIGGVHRGTLTALRYARSLSDDVTAVHVALDAAEADAIRNKWETWGEGVRLVILDSPYRLMLEPLLEYIRRVDDSRQPNDMLTVVVPQFVPRRWIFNLLHTQTAWLLRIALLFRPEIVITDVPYQVN
jgi:hypothetical protein